MIDMSSTATTQATAPLALNGRSRKTTEDGRVTVTITRIMPAVFSVVTEQGTWRCADWCRSYATQAEAEDAQDHTIAAFEAYGTDTAIAQRTEALRFDHARLADRARRRMATPDSIAEALRELDSLATLAELALLDQLRTQFANAA